MNGDEYIVIPDNIEVNIEVFAILIGVDRTMLNLIIGHDYNLSEVFLDNIKYKEKIIMGDKTINHKYFLSQLKSTINDEEKTSFICISKEDKMYIPHPELKGTINISEKSMELAEMEDYEEIQFKIILDFVSKLMLYKEGDISINEVFFNYNWRLFIVNSKKLDTLLIADSNCLCKNIYTIKDDEITDLNTFITSHNNAFELLRDVIEGFTYSYKLMSDAKAFEQLITALEMLFLKKKQSNKKEALSKRIAVFLSSSDTEITGIYNDINSYYKYRSDSTHEGIDKDISKQALLALRDYTRRAIKEYFEVIEYEYKLNSQISLRTIKSNLIARLMNEVLTKISNGILPDNQGIQ